MNESQKVLNRLALLSKAKNDADLARFLDVSPSTLAMWKTRDTVPYKACVLVSRREKVSLDWLLNGNTPAVSVSDFSELLDAFTKHLKSLEERITALERQKSE